MFLTFIKKWEHFKAEFARVLLQIDNLKTNKDTE